MNINSITSSIKNIFSEANTTTASNDLSANLKKRVQSIIKGTRNSHDSIAVPITAYPIVFVQASRNDPEWRELGDSSRRDLEVNFVITGVTHEGMSSGDERTSRETADSELLELANNIEQIVHNNVTMSSTVQWIQVDSSDYSANVADKAYNSVVEVTLRARVRQ